MPPSAYRVIAWEPSIDRYILKLLQIVFVLMTWPAVNKLSRQTPNSACHCKFLHLDNIFSLKCKWELIFFSISHYGYVTFVYCRKSNNKVTHRRSANSKLGIANRLFVTIIIFPMQRYKAYYDTRTSIPEALDNCRAPIKIAEHEYGSLELWGSRRRERRTFGACNTRSLRVHLSSRSRICTVTDSISPSGSATRS